MKWTSMYHKYMLLSEIDQEDVMIGGALELEEDGYVIEEGPPIFNMRLGSRHEFFGVGVEEYFHVNFTERWEGSLIKSILKELHQVF